MIEIAENPTPAPPPPSLTDRLLADPDLGRLSQQAETYLTKIAPKETPPLTLEERLLQDPNLPLLAEKARQYLESKQVAKLTPKPAPEPPKTILKRPALPKVKRANLARTAVAAVSLAAAGIADQPENFIPPPPPAIRIEGQMPSLNFFRALAKEPTPTTTETAKENAFETILKPFVDEANKRRQERAKNDPEYAKRVDQELNQNRLNFVIFAYSEEHGDTYENYGGFPTVLSYDLKSGQIGIVHFSRDIRVPELERKFPEDSIENQRVRRIYKKGGFEGMRWILERMSGLAIDYQIVLKDVVVRDAIEKLTDGSLEIEVTKDHKTGPYRFGRVEYGDGFIPKGKQTMDTPRLIQYLSAEDKTPGGKEDERSYRKNQVFEAFAKKMEAKIKANPMLIVNILNFIKAEVDAKNTEIDFDLNLLTRSGQVVQGLMGALVQYLGEKGQLEMRLPAINHLQQHVFHDSVFGDGGVTRVHHIKDRKTDTWQGKPEIFTRLQKEELSFWMLIPDGGDPYAKDLITDYWQSVRQLVKEKLQPSIPTP